MALIRNNGNKYLDKENNNQNKKKQQFFFKSELFFLAPLLPQLRECTGLSAGRTNQLYIILFSSQLDLLRTRQAHDVTNKIHNFM